MPNTEWKNDVESDKYHVARGEKCLEKEWYPRGRRVNHVRQLRASVLQLISISACVQGGFQVYVTGNPKSLFHSLHAYTMFDGFRHRRATLGLPLCLPSNLRLRKQ